MIVVVSTLKSNRSGWQFIKHVHNTSPSRMVALLWPRRYWTRCPTRLLL